MFCAVLSISLLLAITASAGTWYVVKHDLADMAIINSKPGPRWTVVSGPYDTKAAAARAEKIDIPQKLPSQPEDRAPTKKQ